MEHDIIIVGGSFAGLSAALQIARARRRVLVIDAEQPRNRFSEKSHGFFGLDDRPPYAILGQAKAQLLAYPTASLVEDRAKQVMRDGDLFQVAMDSEDVYRSSRVVLATGIVDELPAVPGMSELWGEKVLHCPYCHGYEVCGDRLGVFAKGEPSLNQALLIRDWGNVTLFAQGLDLAAEGLRKLEARGVKVEVTPIVAVEDDHENGMRARLLGGRHVQLDALFVAPEVHLAGELTTQLGCSLVQGPHGMVVATDEHKETSVKGVYAAGDMARMHHNAMLACADGVIAGISAHQSLVL
jgi:thioredoxin reductase